ncbi:ATP-binding protein [Candidatus Tisiphia endosymbiont of Nedyus quadrimaculatus]|uniref:ATP-binding protein n=1 Tax=Candidatus Tisiphia endosymbiont of Nedyus quadrimaculatus TaxID=3139332 RepID=UPI00345E622D
MKDLILLLDKLGLVGMKMQLAESSNLTNDVPTTSVYDVLKKLLEAECEYKKSRSLGYRLQLAKFPTIKLLSDTCQAKLVENIDIQKVIDNHQNIMFIGGSGSAKTHLAIGLAFTAIEKSYRVRFYTLNELASQLLNARIHNYESKFIDSVKRFHLIVVDELGYVPIKAEARFLLFELFAKLYEQTSVIITTHLRFEEWNDMFGNAKATKVIIDRLTHHCQIIETGNKSFRGGKDVD